MSPRSLSFGTLEEVPEEGLFVFVSLSPGVFRKETQRKAKLSVIVSCVAVSWCSEAGFRRRLVCYLCSLSSGTLLIGVPGEGFCVPGVVCPLVLRERYQGKACLCLCSLSPGVKSWVPWGSLIVFLCFCCCVVCLAVKQGEPPEKAMPPLPILPHNLLQFPIPPLSFLQFQSWY